MDSLRIRTTLAILAVAAAFVWVLPNVSNVAELSWWPSKSKLNYGLDIQGGLHLVMGADVDAVVRESVTRLAASLKEEYTKDGIGIVSVLPKEGELGALIVTLENPADLDRAEKHIGERYASMLQVVSGEGKTLELRYFDAYLTDYKDRVIQQSIETLRNRIDEFGVAEPSITRQGESRILVQLPGAADAERAKELINTTAKLDFMIVSREMSMEELAKLVKDAETAGKYSLADMKYSEYVPRINKDLEGKIPAHTVVYFEKAENAQTLQAGAIPVLLQTDTNLGGKDLDDASIGYDQFGQPNVHLRFNSAGATRFADLTGNNVGRQMAIVLDKVVKSAPNLKERIGGGSAEISLGGGRNRDAMMNEAKMISTSLRAGALPASLEQLEERTIGPSLGADSIQKAKIGSFVGAALVVLFILVYYKAMGIIATFCLSLNILTLFSLLTTLGATLTLPGIAGIALSVGVAVDANVLINERIKDELRAGGSFKLAIQEGYNRAMSAILDSNITTAATAFVLLYFGTGPVRGFAVTLLLGIVTTLFANVFVSKVVVDNLVHKLGVKKISV